MMYDYQNIGYQMSSAPNPMMQMPVGGYPAGYPPIASPQMGYGVQMMNPMPMTTGYGANIVSANPQMQYQPNMSMPAQQPQNYISPEQYAQDMKKAPDLTMPIPGVTTPLEIEFNDGTSITLPPQQPQPSQQAQMAMGYTPGGARVSQGGFNPASGVTTPAVGNPGFNPYSGMPNMAPQGMPGMQQPMYQPPTMVDTNTVMSMINQMQNGPSPQIPQQQLIGNPGYMAPGQQPTRMPNPCNFGMGFAPYSPPGVDPYAFKQPWQQQPGFTQTPMGQQMGLGMYPFHYGQNQFNYTLQDLLYDEQPSAIDARAMLADVILSDEEKERVGQMRSEIIGYDYYQRPILSGNGAYRQAQEKQRMFEEARYQYQSYFTHLAKVAHAYSGEKIDEDAMMKRFDPVPPPPPAPKMFNIMTATEDERREYNRNMIVAQTADLEMRSAYYEAQKANNDLYRQSLYAQIKASHDKLIGVEPGEHYDLKTYMDNGYKIGVDIAMRKAKSANRNGTTKYSRSGFRANMNANPRSVNQAQVPITSTDDEYVSVEAMLKSVYNQNKARMYQSVKPVDESQMMLVRDKSGRVSYMSKPDPGVLPNLENIDAILDPNASERDSHLFFLETLQKKKELDEAKQGLR